MPKKTIGSTPFEVVLIDSDTLINENQLLQILEGKTGVSICIRTENGHSNRGGYFLHIMNTPPLYSLEDFEGNVIDQLDISRLCLLANHISGKLFSDEMLMYCQTVINFRID